MRRERGEEVSYFELAALPTAPFWARRQAKNALRAWQLQPATVETAELLVSELITNAMKVSSTHCEPLPEPGSENAQIALTLRRLPGRVVIEVFDNDPNPPLLSDSDLDAESGRGLLLVQALSKEWGHFFPPSGGKTVRIMQNP